MPDQSSASSEHALIQEITAPLATLPDDPVPVAADVDFPVVLRGYDRIAVDAYVRKTSQLVAELTATRSPEAAIRRALERVGEEVSGILQRAHETAAQITAKSRSEAEDRLEAARQEAAQITAAAEVRVKELDTETDRIWSERHRIVEDTRELARQLVALAESAAARFPAEEAPAETVVGDVPSPPEIDETAVTQAFAAPFAAPDAPERGPEAPEHAFGEPEEHEEPENPEEPGAEPTSGVELWGEPESEPGEGDPPGPGLPT
jgi:cell division septum initiation protein DivIVA